MITLETLAKRICIIGSSCNGKSTLAEALSKKLFIPCYHLDLLAHKPNTKWEKLPFDIWITKHHDIVKKRAWIIEGNYSCCMKERFERATAVIWLDQPALDATWRYIKRCFINDSNRPGRLSGVKQDFRFWLLKHILFHYPKNKLRYQKLLKQQFPDLLLIHIKSMNQLKQLYEHWKLN